MDLFLLCFSINTILAIYVGFILPLKGIMDYEVYLGKRVTYIATICGVISFFSITIAVWKCWGFWTIPMLFVMFMGYIMTAHFFPGNQIGSVLSALTFVLICCSSYFIDHDGHFHYAHEDD